MITTDSLTQDQQKVFKGFVQFLLDPKQKSMIIQGSAGTGKSYLTKYLIEAGIENYMLTSKALGITPEYTDYEVCATTNKAVDSLETELDLPGSKSVTTLTALMRLHLAYDPNTKHQTLVCNYNWTPVHNKIIFIDECSMISTDLAAALPMTFKHCKFVFIGDKFQLPPVKEKESVIYQLKIPEYDLNKPVRNAGKPALVELCKQLEETCKTGKWHDIHSVPGSIEVIRDGAVMQKLVDQNFTQIDPDKKILAYSNATVTQYAQYIMQLRGEKDYIAAGNWYTSNEYYCSNPARSMNAYKLNIDSPVRVEEVSTDVPLTCYQELGLSEKDKDKDVLIKVTVWNPKRNAEWSSVMFRLPDDYLAYMKTLVKVNPKKYYSLKSQILDLRRSEVSTVHKAQGQTLDTVYIDLCDISRCTQKDLTAKLLYVAASRAKNKVVFYGELSKRYGVSVL